MGRTMPARKRNGQFTKRRSSGRRRNPYKKAINVPNTALSLVTMNAFTRTLFDTNLMTFLGLSKNFGPTYPATNNSWEITLKELFTPGMGVASTYTQGFAGAVERNVKVNLGKSVAMVLGAQAFTKVAKQLGVMRNLNKLVRAGGLGKVVKF